MEPYFLCSIGEMQLSWKAENNYVKNLRNTLLVQEISRDLLLKKPFKLLNDR
jgi:hypothetical protein